MNKLLRVAETLPDAPPLPLPPMTPLSPKTPLPHCPRAGPPAGGRGPRPAGPGCPQAAGFAAWHWLCPAAAPACHSSTWHNNMAIKACTKGCLSSPRETLFLREQEEEALRSGRDCDSKTIQPPLSPARTFHGAFPRWPRSAVVTLCSSIPALGHFPPPNQTPFYFLTHIIRPDKYSLLSSSF